MIDIKRRGFMTLLGGAAAPPARAARARDALCGEGSPGAASAVVEHLERREHGRERGAQVVHP